MRWRLPWLVEILRPHNMLAAAACVAAGYRIAGGAEASMAARLALVTALVTGAGNAINDACDVEIDRVNKPFRPIPSGRTTRRAALVLWAVLTVATTAMAPALLPRGAAAVMLAWQAGLALYAVRLKRAFLAGNVLVAAIAASAFVAGALAAGDPGAVAWPAAATLAFVTSRELIKGAEDVEGDRRAGVDTVACRIGPARAAAWASRLLVAMSAVVPMAGFVGPRYGPAFVAAFGLGVVPLSLHVAWSVWRHPDRATLRRASRRLKLGMFVGILAFVLAGSSARGFRVGGAASREQQRHAALEAPVLRIEADDGVDVGHERVLAEAVPVRRLEVERECVAQAQGDAGPGLDVERRVGAESLERVLELNALRAHAGPDVGRGARRAREDVPEEPVERVQVRFERRIVAILPRDVAHAGAQREAGGEEVLQLDGPVERAAAVVAVARTGAGERADGNAAAEVCAQGGARVPVGYGGAPVGAQAVPAHEGVGPGGGQRDRDGAEDGDGAVPRHGDSSRLETRARRGRARRLNRTAAADLTRPDGGAWGGPVEPKPDARAGARGV